MKTIRNNLTFVTVTISLMLCLLLPVYVHALSIAWDPWTLGIPSVTKSTYGAGSGNSKPHTLQAIAVVSPTINPASWFSENATTSISLSSFFTVEGAAGQQGKSFPGFLFGNLTGTLGATGFDFKLTGSYNSSVTASVNAGFATWSNPAAGHSISGDVFFLDAITKPVDDNFKVPGILTVGNKYPLFHVFRC